MTTKNILTFVFMMFLFPYFSFSQNLNRMKEEKRNEMLIKIATEAVHTYIPDYYREYSVPKISKYTVTKADQEMHKDKEYGMHAGRILYSVKFMCDPQKEYFRNEFSAEVQIWGDNGDLYFIICGNLEYGRAFRDKEARTFKKVLYPYIKAERPTQYTTVKKLTPEEAKEQWKKLVEEFWKEKAEKEKEKEKKKEK